ncbi:MAG: hypothetical protein AUJ49_11405 [Desulfovibrionaceae bacterium CG1_02_65_16]|nr:MAG: hypothetical protein AUJ49_11405 [Desulfovibrionaceae bacterium CG1_02_65_16]
MASQPEAGTKERLLEAARMVFAERGLRDATVRDICARAGANVAAVNYYFGSKEKLYTAVLADYLEKCHNRYPTNMGIDPDATPPQRLKAYIRSLLYRLMGDGDPVGEKLGQLLTAEIIEPSEYFHEVARRYIMPVHVELTGIIRRLLPQASDRTVRLCAAAVTGHCMLFDNAKQLIRRMQPDIALETLGVELVANFVYDFAQAGIARMAEPA